MVQCFDARLEAEVGQPAGQPFLRVGEVREKRFLVCYPGFAFLVILLFILGLTKRPF